MECEVKRGESVGRPTKIVKIGIEIGISYLVVR